MITLLAAEPRPRRHGVLTGAGFTRAPVESNRFREGQARATGHEALATRPLIRVGSKLFRPDVRHGLDSRLELARLDEPMNGARRSAGAVHRTTGRASFGGFT